MTAAGGDGIVARLGALTEPALFIAIAGRVWQSLAGLLTLYFVVTYFTPEIQGFHQTFLSLLALQAFAELSVLIAVISVVSHEWAGLAMGPGRVPTGKEESRRRLAAIARFVTLWFLGAALVFLLAGGVVGMLILSKQGAKEFWLWPWMVTIATASVLLWCQGITALLEGSNQVLEVALYRLVSSIAGSVVLILAIMAGAGIWSLAAMLATQLLCTLGFLLVVYRRFLWSLLRHREPSTFSWKADIWPMQWPLALQGVTAYFMFSLFVPVIYSYHGVVEAGKTGISIQVVMALLGVATTLLVVKAPRLGTMYARGEFDKFETTWINVSAASLAILLLGSILVGAVLIWGHAYDVPSVRRFLDPLPFVIFLCWGLLLHWVQCTAAYWRAQRREPVRGWGAVPGLVAGSCVWYFGREGGAAGAAAAALGSTLLLSIPMSLYFLASSRRITAELRGTSSGLSGAITTADRSNR